LGGVFTTVEGLLEKISDTFEENNPFADSDKELSNKVAVLLSEL
jgi:C4-type Zn-finger protein